MEKLLRVGTLARRTGISVRTLHHYHEIGLLTPSARSASGHRLYGPADVIRLQQIRSLRQLGFSLEAVRSCLRDPGIPTATVLDMHLRALKAQMEQLAEVTRRLEGLQRWLGSGEEPTIEDLLRTLEVTNRVEQYYTPEQLEELRRRREQVGEEQIGRVEAEWPWLIAAMKAAMEAGTDPADPGVQDLTRRWQALVQQFTGGNPEIAASLNRMYENEPAARERAGVDPALFDYVNRAIAAAQT